MTSAEIPGASLLAPEASGGDTAEGGFAFQEALLLAKLPRLLADDSFTALVREALCDFEASFFVPGRGVRREGFEAKNYRLTPALFWAEIEAFQRIDSGSGGAFGGFTLACAGLSDELNPVMNGVRRVRDPYRFYDPGSGVLETSYAEYEARVVGLGRSKDIARFIFEKVRVEPTWGSALIDGEALFVRAAHEALPWSLDQKGSDLARAYEALKRLVQSRKNQPITRHEIEAALVAALPPGSFPARPLVVHTTSDPDEVPRAQAIVFRWHRFFGGGGRVYPPPEVWDTELVPSLRTFHSWAVENRRSRRIRLSGNRRLSAAFAIGSVLSAVAGYTIEMEYRGELWATDAHPDEATPAYALRVTMPDREGPRLTVAVGLLRDVSADVAAYTAAVGLDSNPVLHLCGEAAVKSSRQGNLLARLVKEAINNALVKTGAGEIDLFYSGPSHTALFIGHRLNATAPVRCYEWLAPGQYVPTCLIFGPQ